MHLPPDVFGLVFDALPVAGGFQFLADAIDSSAVLQGEIGKLIGGDPLAVPRTKQSFDFICLCRIRRIYVRVALHKLFPESWAGNLHVPALPFLLKTILLYFGRYG